MDCLFCKIARGEIASQRLYEDDHMVAFRDVNPQAPTHVLLVPRRHIATLNELQEADIDLMGRLLLQAQRIAKAEGIADAGYRTVFNCNRDGGQSVYHIHLHILGGRALNWPPG